MDWKTHPKVLAEKFARTGLGFNRALPSDQECKAYNAALHHAAMRAYETRKQYWVYRVGETFFVRATDEPAPEYDNVCKVCIAQWWTDQTVQLRFDGGHSEWVNL
jgi:hypothetical protein